MKVKLLTHALMFLLFLAFLNSCKKEEVKPTTQPASPQASSAQHAIAVEYRVYAASGNFKLSYKAPQADKLITYQTTLSKMMHTITFDWVSGETFKIEASNTDPSAKEITVEIYINGILYDSGLANAPNAVASARAQVYQ